MKSAILWTIKCRRERLIINDELTSEQWMTVHDAITRRWAELSIHCVCGCAFASHAMHSPHNCFRCGCPTFTAAEPLVVSGPHDLQSGTP